MADKKLPFEKALGRLEDIVSELEGGDLELEKSLSRFEEGIKMARACKEQLTVAEQRIEKLLKNSEGEVSTEPLSHQPSNLEPAGEDSNHEQDDLPF